ncbi:hypothetical protein HN51_030547 [Arachis hypogaea]
MAARLCKSDDRKISKWAKCKESHSLVSPTHNKRNLAVECTGYDSLPSLLLPVSFNSTLDCLEKKHSQHN